MSRLAVVLFLASLLLPGVAFAKPGTNAVAHLEPVAGSGVTGVVHLRQSTEGGEVGVDIQVVAHGLQPGGHYLSIYYGNAACDLEPDSLQNDVIGRYVANPGGVGMTRGRPDDPLDEIRSVSVRLDNNTSEPPLLACAVF